jgi:hypothetical protein
MVLVVTQAIQCQMMGWVNEELESMQKASSCGLIPASPWWA